MSDVPASTNTPRPYRKRAPEFHIPLLRREDRAGGDYFIGVGLEASVDVNLADFVVLVLLGREGGPGPTLVFRARDATDPPTA